MGTGVAPKRIATRSSSGPFDSNLGSFVVILFVNGKSFIYLKSASLLFARFKPSSSAQMLLTLPQASFRLITPICSAIHSLITK